MAELTVLINQHNEAYYNFGESQIDDTAFDLLINQLIDLETQFPEFARSDSPTQRVGGNPTIVFENIRHKHPMLSLSNLYSEQDLIDWVRSVQNRLESDSIQAVCEVKIDGVAISISYQQGKLIQAITRGNGEVGDDVTNNVKTIRSLPITLKKSVTLDLRGEIFLPKERFDKINEFKLKEGKPAFKNPRNAAAGTIRMKDSKIVSQRGLDILLYDIVEGQNSEFHSQNLDELRDLGLPVNPHRKKCGSAEEIFQFCSEWQTNKRNLPFDIDGVVIKLEKRPDREIMGFTAKTPRWATAWKFKAEKVTTPILSIENSIGRTGTLTPVANLAPVQLMGTEVKRATLHNYEQVLRLGIHSGDTVFVEKGGDIIPKIVGIDYTRRIANSKPLVAPTHCPVCGESLTRVEVEVDLRCENPICPAIIEGTLEHFVSKKGLDIQYLGSAIIKLFIEKGFVKELVDIFYLSEKREELMKMEGFGKKSVDNLLVAIEESKQTSLNQYIYAFGIRHIGEKAAKTIASKITGLEELLSLQKERFETIKDFGNVMVESLVGWTQKEQNRMMVHKLIQAGVDPAALEQNSNQPFENTTIVITGTLTVSRSEWKNKLERLGFKVSSSLSKKTDYLLAGEKAGSKLEKAKSLNVSVVSEEEITDLIMEKTT